MSEKKPPSKLGKMIHKKSTFLNKEFTSAKGTIKQADVMTWSNGF